MEKETVIQEMKKVFEKMPYGADHSLRVLGNAEAIMENDDVCAEMQEVITMLALLHDIGAPEADRKYGSVDAPYHEETGPAVARGILEKVGFNPGLTNRVCYVIGHHHQRAKIDGQDFQILWEAEMLDNLEHGVKPEDKSELEELICANFQTPAGRNLAMTRLMNVPSFFEQPA